MLRALRFAALAVTAVSCLCGAQDVPPRAAGVAAELAALGDELATLPSGADRARRLADLAARAVLEARTEAQLDRRLAPGERATHVAGRRAALERSLAVLEPLANELAAAPTPDDLEPRARLFLELGELRLERGALGDSPSAGDSFEAADAHFARVAGWFEEGTPLALRAELGRAETRAARGEMREAAARYASIAERAVPSDLELWREAAPTLTRDDRARRFALLELASPGLIATLLADRRADEACRAGLRWWSVWRTDGFALSSPSGENTATELARAHAAAAPSTAPANRAHQAAPTTSAVIAWREDERDAAWFPNDAAARAAGATDVRAPREFAARVLRAWLDGLGERPPTSAARVRATELVLDERVGADPELERRLAHAAFDAGDWSAARALFARATPVATAGVKVDAGGDALAAERLWHLARCAEELGEPRAAADGFREIVERHRASSPWASRAAEGWYRVIGTLPLDTPELGAEREAATRAARELATGAVAADAAYRDADRLLREKRFAEARAAFAAVPPEAPTYELAWVHRAVCDYQLGELDAAERAFGEFLDVRCADPNLAPVDAARSARRSEARATAELYHGLIAFGRAERNQGDWLTVRRRLEPYLERHASQVAYAPLAASRALIACLRLGDFAAAERLEGELFTQFPDSRWSGAAALEMYREREKQRAALAPDDTDRATQLARAMARELELVNRTAPEPSFANLRAESRAWLALREWARARAVLERLVALFGSSERADLEKWVLPDLARAWAVDGEPARAAAVLEPLVAAGRASPQVRRFHAQVLGGWCEFEAPGAPNPRGEPVEFAGVEDAASAARAQELFAALRAEVPRFEADWYGLRFDALYARWRRGRVEPAAREAALAEFQSLADELGGDFERLADPALARRFRWLRTLAH
ncbi:MAG: hypothetical protein IT453_02630 [Planctomycetes bacterium]|nr:hypothetical protein [Planctomycetota bacterium]